MLDRPVLRVLNVDFDDEFEFVIGGHIFAESEC
jgi:hypothetical protein